MIRGDDDNEEGGGEGHERGGSIGGYGNNDTTGHLIHPSGKCNYIIEANFS